MHTLLLTTEERDMLRDFMQSYFPVLIETCEGKDKKIAESLYNKIDNLDPEEVAAS